MDFVQQPVQMVVRMPAKDVREVVKMVVPQHVVAVVDRIVKVVAVECVRMIV
ncbi:MAG: hypothetical protein K6A78_09455 [Prevotella sp.]|nr:hypothetical protein [Prevotella sp.]